TLHADGSFSYKAAVGFRGVDGFTYKPNDGAADGNVTSVLINDTAVNTAPVGTADTYSLSAGSAFSATAAQGVLANDTDAEGDHLTAILVAAPTHGTLSFDADGAFRYTPDTGFHAADTFTYKPNDGQADGNVVSVTLNVAQVPLALTDVKGLNIKTIEGRLSTSLAVARYTDPNPLAKLGDYHAVIDWGDGTPASPAIITQPGGAGTPFFITASHTYVDSGVTSGTGHFVTSARILNPNGPDLMVTGSADVADVPIVLTGRLASSSDSGRSSSDGITNDNT